MIAIEATGLGKSFGKVTALAGLDLNVPPGRVCALLGPNGAGKTTAVRILATLTRPDAGTARVAGYDVARQPRRVREVIGLAGQHAAVDDDLTGRENLFILGLMHHLGRPGAGARASALLEQFGLAEALALYAGLFPQPMGPAEVIEMIDLASDADTRIGALSGGRRRRVDLGLGIIGRPEVLFLDEPTTGLDPEARRELWAVIQSLVAAGTTVLLTTHYIEEAQRLADRVIVLAEGRVVADATPDQLRARGGVPVIRYRLPPGTPARDLPPVLSRYVDPGRGELSLPSADVTADLDALVGWARRNRADLTGLEVNPPSLEDAYIALTTDLPPAGEPADLQKAASHG